jgi:hypothetical protein
MSKNDGGPAFPMPHVCNVNNGTMEWGETGMSLRDWFAGQALTGALANPNRYNPDTLPSGYVVMENLAKDMVAIADALIAELAKEVK